MRILVLGNGGREYAEVLACSTSPLVQDVLFAPGNAGVAQEKRRVLDMKDFPGIFKCAHEEKVDLICVGPEVPLCAGFVDDAEKTGLKAFGPNRLAAEFEADKHLTKRLCKQFNIRTADYQIAHTMEGVQRAITDWGFPIVLKYPNLAAGKGVKVAKDPTTAVTFAKSVLDGFFGYKKLLVEKFVPGRDYSYFAVCNGEEGIFIGDACDYKLASDTPGENRMTGGMGAYSPVPWMTPHMRKRVKDEILDPLLRAMKAEGRPYRGILYLGLMIDPEGNPWLIEINCRGGDPEMQVVLPRLEDGVFVELMLWSLGLGPKPGVKLKSVAAVYTVLCAIKYPDNDYEKGYPVNGLERALSVCRVIHAGTEIVDGVLVASGGRVLGTLGLSSTLEGARDASQAGANLIAGASNGKLRYRKSIAAGL